MPGSAPQHASGRTEWTFRLKDVGGVLRQLHEMQTEFAEAAGQFEDALDDLVLVLEELLVNLLNHSGRRESALECRLSLIADDHTIWCEWIDNGLSFDPFEAPLAEPSADGGVGLPLVRHFARDCSYDRRGDFNHLSFTVPLSTAV
ncbi:MAG: ATP-binding protein [Xanthomonadales bacterium]|nr:ATP-binding protein [Xanthomonadales bacterium]MCB1626086.1 ATP-binding protein [Xanthomonadales bacterium]MCB1633955.1 ATP-binding protein [Xanthomonadales bacterium]MCB1641718.1 ATP-binding protein [Xanthomonadales bacterium]